MKPSAPVPDCWKRNTNVVGFHVTVIVLGPSPVSFVVSSWASVEKVGAPLVELNYMVRELGRITVGARPEPDVELVIGRVDREPAVGYYDRVHTEVASWLAGKLGSWNFIFEP